MTTPADAVDAQADALEAQVRVLRALAAVLRGAEGAPATHPSPPKKSAPGRRRGPTLAERLDALPSATVIPEHQVAARRALKRAGEPIKE